MRKTNRLAKGDMFYRPFILLANTRLNVYNGYIQSSYNANFKGL